MSEWETPSGHIGTVTGLENGIATVRFTRSKMCADCGACLTVGDKEVEMRVKNALHAKPGDRVEVTLAPKRVMQATLLAYVMPLLLLIAGVWAGSLLSDAAALVGGLLGCGIAFLVLRLTEKKRKSSAAFEPRMTALYASQGEKA